MADLSSQEFDQGFKVGESVALVVFRILQTESPSRWFFGTLATRFPESQYEGPIARWFVEKNHEHPNVISGFEEWRRTSRRQRSIEIQADRDYC